MLESKTERKNERVKTVTQLQLSTAARRIPPGGSHSVSLGKAPFAFSYVTQDSSTSHNFHSGADAITISHRTMRHAVDSGHRE